MNKSTMIGENSPARMTSLDTSAMIEVSKLDFTYPGAAKSALRQLGFAVRTGEIFGFLGPSGAGKSTTQKILIGLLKGYGGEVGILGRSLREWKRDLYDHIGVAFELPNHYTKLTALENLEMFRSFYNGETDTPLSLLEKLGLAEDARTRVGAFSKGMKMRLNFARALLNRPKILFCDEPTSGMDPGNARRIKDLLLECKTRGAAVLLTTHNMELADELCDRVAFIVDGEIKITDSPANLRRRNARREVTVTYRENEQLLTTTFALAELGRDPLFTELAKANRIESIHSRETTLEQIFLEVTGSSLS